MTRKLAPGEIVLSDVEINGHRGYVRCLNDGTFERGTAVLPDHPCAPHATGFVRPGDEIRPGVRRVVEEISYTTKGPARVATAAYRSGWDDVFGQRSGGDECKQRQAN